MKSLAVVIPATKSYLYAIHDQAVKLQPILADRRAYLFFVTDESKEGKKAFSYYEKYLTWVQCNYCPLPIPEYVENRGEEASLLMARMQSFGFSQARSSNVDECLSLEADILPPPNALRVLENVLDFDDGYYSIAAGTYANSAFLGGRGSYQNAIAEDFLPEERDLPKELAEEWKKLKEVKVSTPFEAEAHQKKVEEILRKTKEWPPLGNVFTLNGKAWRKRGWFEHAYPAIGRGAIVPSDWCGLGLTLMSKKALELADFTGFDGKGTQDLYLCWHRWNPNGLRIAVTPHILCDHIKRIKDPIKMIPESKNDASKVIPEHQAPATYGLHNWHAYHEPLGESEGHLRMIDRPYHSLAIVDTAQKT